MPDKNSGGEEGAALYRCHAAHQADRPDKNSSGEEGAAPLPPAGLSYVVCGEPLLKAEFLDGLARRCGNAVYIDLDMMYGGFLRAGMAAAGGPPAGGPLHIRAAGGAAARAALSRAVSAVSARASTVVIDTLNGLYDASGGTSGGEARADAAVMILAMAARHTSSRVVVACIAERRGQEWYLRPGGRRLPGAGGKGAAWLRIVRGDRRGEGGCAIGLEAILAGRAPGRPDPAPAARGGADAPNGVIRAPNGVIIGPSGASYISSPGGQGAQCQ